tara:strand:+ start:777 stop:965 length:189 start_codon:yes stop_codon:yes gene_type:complete
MGTFFSLFMSDCSNSKVLDDVDLELSPILKANIPEKTNIPEITLGNRTETINITHKHPVILL